MIKIFFLLYFPLLLLIILPIIVIFKIKRTSDKEVSIDIFSLFQIPFPLNVNFPIRGRYLKWLINIIIVISISYYYLSLDFTIFFPKKLEMTVHFNEKNGINDLLTKMELNEINGISIATEEKEIDSFFKYSDIQIKKYLGYEDYYATAVLNNLDYLETTGKTTFIVEKTGGIQNYRIVSSIGELNHVKKIKDKSEERMTTKFHKEVSQNDKISIETFSQIFRKIIIAPKFSQSLLINAKGEEKLEEYLYGVTLIKTFPYPIFSSTLYLCQRNNKLIPIGYAEYYQTNK